MEETALPRDILLLALAVLLGSVNVLVSARTAYSRLHSVDKAW